MLKLLEVRDAWFTYPGGIRALRGASLAANRGEVTVVMGPNGCGKTTLLLVSAGLLRPESGEVLLDGRSLEELLPAARRRIGIVFQEPDDQLFNPTVYDEIAFALRQLSLPSSEVDRAVRATAKRLRIDHLLERPPYTLSTGEKKRVALASVLAYEPEILFLDEPTANLSADGIDELEILIDELRREGKAIVIATHDVEFAARVADVVYAMKEGTTIGSGPARDVLSDEDLMARIGMKPPIAVRLYRLLLGSGNTPLTLEELVSELRSLLAGKRGNVQVQRAVKE